jgi:cyclin B
LISSKYEEIYAPDVQELVEMTDNAYTRDEVLQVECIMLNTLTFELAVPTPFFFSQRFLMV